MNFDLNFISFWYLDTQCRKRWYFLSSHGFLSRFYAKVTISLIHAVTSSAGHFISLHCLIQRSKDRTGSGLVVGPNAFCRNHSVIRFCWFYLTRCWMIIRINSVIIFRIKISKFWENIFGWRIADNGDGMVNIPKCWRPIIRK